MCQISDELEVCTCNSVKGKKVYFWFLSRYKESSRFIVGDVVVNYFERTDSFKETHQQLENLLNEKNRFDQDLEFQPGDMLKIKLPGKDKNKIQTFDFEFIGEAWVKTIVSPFSNSEYRLDKRGVIVI